ncbi:MAG: terminase large subunit domain-containing protein [Thermoleophilaceae bacterium]
MNLATFSERVLRRPLWPHQIEAADSGAFITTIAKARRTGGTVLAETLAIHTAFSNRGCRVLILSATQDAARRLTESIALTLNANPDTRGALVDDFATRVRLANGSEIISLPASQRQVRGYGARVLLVILDEAGFMPSELWTAAHYTALDERANGSRILMLGTPWGGAEHFFRRAFAAGEEGDPDHSSHHWTYEANPLLDRAYLERQRERVSPVEYAAEVLGEWSDAVGSLFPRALLERQTADVEVPDLSGLLPAARPVVGMDWGVSFDASAAVHVYRLPVAALNPDAEPRPRFIAVPHVWPAGTPLSQVVDDVALANLPWRFIATETNGVGAMPSQEVEAQVRRSQPRLKCMWFRIATTNATKTASYGAILGLLEQGQLVLPRHPDLLRQLAGLRFEQGERGFTRIEADTPATHDDVADALALVAMPHARLDGRGVTCRLAVLARRDGTVPDASPALPEDVEVATTGGGLRLPRRPVLQSVAGPELTYPRGSTPAYELSPEGQVNRMRARVWARVEQREKEVASAKAD